MVELDQPCQICAGVDLYSLFTGPRYIQELGTLKDIKSNARCPLCRLVKHALYENATAPLRGSPWFHPKEIDDRKMKCVLLPRRQDYNEETGYGNPRTGDLVATQIKISLRRTPDYSDEDALSIYEGSVKAGFQLLSPGSVDPARPLANGFQVTTMQRNIELLSQWLSTCRNTHNNTCQGGSFSAVFSPAGISKIRLINVQSRTISEYNIAEAEYAALSYVWGENKEARMKLVSELPPGLGSSGATAVSLPSEIPKVVEDALRICSALSIVHLWVDLYCIDQNDAQQKAAEINAMGYIYNHAQITLIDGHGKNSSDANAGLLPEDILSNLGGNQRIETIGDKSYITSLPGTGDRIHESQWATRSWTYQ
ncbi:hypothetical protein PFICI_05741 [Pestalotiopsis fici W106-1]|uniref:Heterokaryon incompatibility domain-containing protein n=1 Tax=Pestalotiopsis fici (strain W106-1 / CGMCC3.15140) TaxID=1229662 RepID=W3XCS8_PESFW|nr:uncharacterized protein PFICI_05741 [Pestalotiopsis fici W106-1]ETS83865.1 hypothetical protein PFICI_05741 [Pestalotiopsis fici W106-1]